MNLSIRKYSGFTLVEVMIALVVLAVGLLGIAKLQGKLVNTAGESKERTEAVTIAEQKIDDLKRFDGVVDDGTATFLFTAITNNAGGNIASVASGNGYGLTWTVVNCYQGAVVVNAGACLGGYGEEDIDNAPPADFDLADSVWYKAVEVTVDWISSSGAEDISLTALLEARKAISLSLPPTDGDASDDGGNDMATEDEIGDEIELRVDTGSDTFRQTEKPLPEIISSGQDKNTRVDFDVVTYVKRAPDPDTGLIDTTVDVALREEFINQSCKCDVSSTAQNAFSAAYVKWDGDSSIGSRFDYLPPMEPKKVATGSVDNAAGAEQLCNICCRDHHDTGIAGTVRYVYDDDAGDGDHKHYDANGDEVTASGAEYIETCRFKRIDGIMRVFQDWQLKAITTVPSQELELDVGGLQVAYTDYASDFVDGALTVASSLASLNTLKQPVSIAVTEEKQLQARAIYIDTIYDDAGNAFDISSYSGTDRLEQTPFAEVNVTMLADWNPNITDDVVAQTDIISIADDDLNTISSDASYYSLFYQRGVVVGNANGTATGYASMELGNNGVTDVTAVRDISVTADVAGRPPTKKYSDINVVVSGVSSIVTVSGNLNISATANPTVTVSPTGTCIAIQQGNTESYSCNVVQGASLTVTVSAVKNGVTYICSGGDSHSFLTIAGGEVHDFTLSCVAP